MDKKVETQLIAIQKNIADALRSANLEKTLSLINEALTLKPGDVFFLNQKASLQKKLGHDQAAEISLLDAIQKNPTYAGSYNNLGLIYYSRADHSKAETLFEEALKRQADYYDAMYNLALCYKAQDKVAEAVASLNSIIQGKPSHLAAHFLLARLLLTKGRYSEAYHRLVMLADVTHNAPDILVEIVSILLEHDRFLEAEPFCELALKSSPNNFQLLYNLAVIKERKRELSTAIHYYQLALEVKPESFEVLNNLGVIYLEQQQIETAKFYLSKAATIQPENKPLKHTLAAISGDQSVQSASDEYIARLFDQYADGFEDHLVTSLEYKVPEILKKTIETYVKPNEHSLDILDLGCGTGLAANVVKKWAKSLIGVDLSPKMLKIAKRKMLFDQAYADSNDHFLLTHPDYFDLIIAADVLVYTGDLDNVFKGIALSLRKDGHFCFSTELTDGDAYLLSQSGRFHHAYSYVLNTANNHGLTLIDFKEEQTRMQHNAPVIGGIYLLQKS